MSSQQPQSKAPTIVVPGLGCFQATQTSDIPSGAAGGVVHSGKLRPTSLDGVVMGYHTLGIFAEDAVGEAKGDINIARLGWWDYNREPRVNPIPASPDIFTQLVHLVAADTAMHGVFLERFSEPLPIPMSRGVGRSMELHFELELTASVRQGTVVLGLAVWHEGRWWL